MAWQLTVTVTSVRSDFVPDDGVWDTEAEARMHAANIVEFGTWVGGAEPDVFMGPMRITHVQVTEV